MRLEATNKNVRGGLNKPPPLPGRVKEPAVNDLFNLALEPTVLEIEESSFGNRPFIYVLNEYDDTPKKFPEGLFLG